MITDNNRPLGKEIAYFYDSNYKKSKRYFKQGKRIICLSTNLANGKNNKTITYKKTIPHTIKDMQGGWLKGRYSYLN